MTTAFSHSEREFIRKKLNEVAYDCLMKYGVKKTTVDQIVQMTGISKGSFYNFYDSKEILFFTVLEEFQKSIIDELTTKLEAEDMGIDQFAELIYELYQKARRSFIMNIIQNNEFEYLMRKIPKDLIIRHHSLDDIFAKKIFSNIKMKDDVHIDTVTASLRAIFMTMVHIKEIGEEDFDEVLKLLIKGLAVQIIEED
ncbi:MAG: TetR/AcrR family transcriptional regulator [Tissierella sp.]|nr:TetR/AcrR family transcriptional regulator [Tissierella sp.]